MVQNHHEFNLMQYYMHVYMKVVLVLEKKMHSTLQACMQIRLKVS